MIIRRLYHQLYSYYLVYVSPKLREREIKVTSKRLEEGQVQKIKKDFEMTQCPTVFTLLMTRANTLSMEQWVFNYKLYLPVYELESGHSVQNPKRKIEY